MRTAAATLTSFDGTRTVQARVARPEKLRDVADLARATPHFVARGSGLSYSPASMAQDAVSIDMRRLDRILAFERSTGAIEVEPGITVGKLTDFLASQGFGLPAVPGYPEVTVGGCVAFDVHGKSQFQSGSFGSWVTRLTLFHPAHGVVVCSRESNRDVFELTIGGLGLTGLITRVGLRTTPLRGRGVEARSVPVRNLREAAELMRSSAAEADCLYSWHDFSARGAKFGRGIVYLERFVPEAPRRAQRRGLINTRTRFPWSVWTLPSASLGLSVFRLLSERRAVRTLPLRSALFPIEGLEFYYAAFGRRGFREYQTIVPNEAWDPFVDKLQQLIESSGLLVTLASLKLFRGSPRSVRFAGDGTCLALDVPECARSLALFSELDALAVRNAAPVNLSKDGRVSPDVCRRVFVGYDSFRTELTRFDPDRRCNSALREQIDV